MRYRFKCSNRRSKNISSAPHRGKVISIGYSSRQSIVTHLPRAEPQFSLGLSVNTKGLCSHKPFTLAVLWLLSSVVIYCPINFFLNLDDILQVTIQRPLSKLMLIPPTVHTLWLMVPWSKHRSTELFSLLSQSGLSFHLPPDLLPWLLSLAMGKHFLYFVMWKGRGMGQPLGAALENNLPY